MTLLSRVTGLARESMKAAFFGAGVQMDAFEAAFRLPNILRRMFAEGAFSQAFVPILAEYHRQRGEDATRELVGRVGTLLAVVLLGVTALGVLAAPWLVYLLASGFAATPGKVELTAQMIRIVFPYILFVSLVSLAGGVLNVYRRFAIPAFTPVLLNLSIIGAAIFLSRYVDPPIVALAWGVFIGGVAQLAFQIVPLVRLGMLPRIDFHWRDEGVRRVLLLMGPAIIGVSAAQISALINTQLAALLGDGRISWITYADRLMEFPSALLGVALGTVLLPTLAKHHSDADHAGYSSLLDWGLRLAFLLALPAAFALWLLAVPLISTLYQYGKFTVNDVLQTRSALHRLQRRPAGVDPGEDPGAGLLCATADQDAGEDRVPHGAGHADVRGDPDVAARARRADARDEPRRLRQRGAPVLVPAAQGPLRAGARLVPVPVPAAGRAGRAGRGAVRAGRTGGLLAHRGLVGEGRTAGGDHRGRRRGVLRGLIAAGVSLGPTSTVERG